MRGLIDEFFVSTGVAEANALKRGQLCYAPGQYISAKLKILELVKYEPTNERLNQYKVLNDPPEDILFKRTPVHDLKLRDDEELLVIRAKRRPMIILSDAAAYWPLGGGRLAEKTRMCAPLYSFHDNDPVELRARIDALEYLWWVYVPEDTTRNLKEGFVRLDRVQVIEESQLIPIQVAASEDFLWGLSQLLRYHMTAEIDPLFLEYRTEALARLSSQRVT